MIKSESSHVRAPWRHGRLDPNCLRGTFTVAGICWTGYPPSRANENCARKRVGGCMHIYTCVLCAYMHVSVRVVWFWGGGAAMLTNTMSSLASTISK